MHTARPLPAPTLLPRYLGLLAMGLLFLSVRDAPSGGPGGSGGGAEAGSGCSGGGLHIGAGVIGVGVIAARGARGCGDAATVGTDVVRGAGRSGDLLDEAVTGSARLGDDLHLGAAADLVADGDWTSAARVAGREAIGGGADLSRYELLLSRHPEIAAHLDDADWLGRYADENPAFLEDLGVEMYLVDPDAFARLGQGVARSGRFQAAVTDAAADRVERAATELAARLDALEGASDAAIAEEIAAVGRRHGLEAAWDEGEVVVVQRGEHVDFTARIARSVLENLGKHALKVRPVPVEEEVPPSADGAVLLRVDVRDPEVWRSPVEANPDR